MEDSRTNDSLPSATPEDLAAAITDCVGAGVRLINLSVALVRSCRPKGERILNQALDHAANHGAIVVVAAGNQSSIGGTALTQHPWSLPVGACDVRGRPLSQSNLGSSIGRRGLSALGEQVNSLASEGGTVLGGGTSAATPLVTGALALVWSEFPNATANQIRLAAKQAHARVRPTLVPPVLNAWEVYRTAARMMQA